MIKRIFIVVLLLGFLVCSIFIFHLYRVFFTSNTAFESPKQEVFIPSSDTNAAAYDTIARVVERFDFFQQAASRKGYMPMPGRFVLYKGMNNNELINQLRSENKPIRLTFNNQNTLMHLAAYIDKKIETDSFAIMQAFYDVDFLKENGLTQDNVFSICLPNSYDVFWNITAEQFRDRMLRQYKAFWTTKREAARKKIKLSREEVVALAAVVHKESYRVDERPLVAGVYLNRLRKRMRLQADPTVIYALMRKANNYDMDIRRVLYSDLKIRSPYNTYLNKGIPPGPISMPDLSAIDAVLFATNHKYLYFVADPSRSGYHLFATNLSKHNKNKKEYSRWLRKKKIYR